jgi:post-segregation antitoxin (ccd killing protein)
MEKQRVTLYLDADIAQALRALGRGAMSPVANKALREALERKAHQAALLEWLDELDAQYGAPSREQLAKADAFLDALERGDVKEPGAA